MVASRRSQFDAAFALHFLQHLERISPLVDQLVEKWQIDFQSRFQIAWAEDEGFEQIIRESRVDPTRLGGWGGPILSGKRTGRMLIELPENLFDLGRE